MGTGDSPHCPDRGRVPMTADGDLTWGAAGGEKTDAGGARGPVSWSHVKGEAH